MTYFKELVREDDIRHLDTEGVVMNLSPDLRAFTDGPLPVLPEARITTARSSGSIKDLIVLTMQF